LHIILRNVRRLLVTANLVHSTPILFTPMIEALRSAKTSVLTRATRRNFPEGCILHSQRREILKSYIVIHNIFLIHRNCIALFHLRLCLVSEDSFYILRKKFRKFRYSLFVKIKKRDYHTRAKRLNIPEEVIFHSHRRDNLKSYIALTGWVL
jgi:hypothetical protein